MTFFLDVIKPLFFSNGSLQKAAFLWVAELKAGAGTECEGNTGGFVFFCGGA